MKPRLARAGGAVAIAVSAVLLVVVTVRSVGLNPANGWTIFVCGAAGVLAIRMKVALASILLIVGAAPAVFGGVAVLYLPSLALLAASSVARPRPVRAT